MELIKNNKSVGPKYQLDLTKALIIFALITGIISILFSYFTLLSYVSNLGPVPGIAKKYTAFR
jgi:hypothetical protein